MYRQYMFSGQRVSVYVKIPRAKKTSLFRKWRIQLVEWFLHSMARFIVPLASRLSYRLSEVQRELYERHVGGNVEEFDD